MDSHEYRLVRRWQCYQDRAALEELVAAQMEHVRAMAYQYRHYSATTPQEDLVGEGLEGLLLGINKFDPNRGVKLLTYASHWMRAKMTQRILNDWSRDKPRSPAARSNMFWRIPRARRRLLAQGRSADEIVGLIAREFGISERRVQRVLDDYDSPDFSLDVPMDPDRDDRTWVDALPDPAPSPQTVAEEAARLRQIQAKAQRALAHLNPRERIVMVERYMVDEPKSLASIGRELGISRERVRQIEVKCMKKMRRALGAPDVPRKRRRAPPAQPAASASPVLHPDRKKLTALLARLKAKSLLRAA